MYKNFGKNGEDANGNHELPMSWPVAMDSFQICLNFCTIALQYISRYILYTYIHSLMFDECVFS